jgi:hypothetical protein
VRLLLASFSFLGHAVDFARALLFGDARSTARRARRERVVDSGGGGESGGAESLHDFCD